MPLYGFLSDVQWNGSGRGQTVMHDGAPALASPACKYNPITRHSFFLASSQYWAPASASSEQTRQIVPPFSRRWTYNKRPPIRLHALASIGKWAGPDAALAVRNAVPRAAGSATHLGDTGRKSREGYVEAVDDSRTRRSVLLDRPGYVAGKLDLDVATAAQIDSLPGVTPTMAKRIVADRMRRGPFLNANGLRRVSGVGDMFLLRIDTLVTFSGTMKQSTPSEIR